MKTRGQPFRVYGMNTPPPRSQRPWVGQLATIALHGRETIRRPEFRLPQSASTRLELLKRISASCLA
jgi:hypothetical protein